MINTNFPWSAKLDWHDANFDLTVVCSNRQQIRCHKSILAAASPFISFLLKEEQPDAVLVLDEVEAVHYFRKLEEQRHWKEVPPSVAISFNSI